MAHASAYFADDRDEGGLAYLDSPEDERPAAAPWPQPQPQPKVRAPPPAPLPLHRAPAFAVGPPPPSTASPIASPVRAAFGSPSRRNGPFYAQQQYDGSRGSLGTMGGGMPPSASDLSLDRYPTSGPYHERPESDRQFLWPRFATSRFGAIADRRSVDPEKSKERGLGDSQPSDRSVPSPC